MVEELRSACGQVTTVAGSEVDDVIHVSENAIRQVSKILSDEPEGTFFRVGVSGGGCSGFQYLFALDDHFYDDDIVVYDGDIKVVSDEVSMPFMKGSTVDYQMSLQASAFVVNNPHVKSQCGCGTSFAV